MTIRERIAKRMQRLAAKHNITYHEVYKIYKSQFEFTAQKIGEYTKEELANMPEEELKQLVFNFIYLGKVYTNKKLQKLGNKKNNLNQGEDGKEEE